MVLLEHPEQVPRTHPVVLVCQSGRRSERATASLCEQGYDNVRVLTGGMIAWERANLLEAVNEDGNADQRT
jgi:rhodanese-related sulfurtransferase